uniref:Uncharacterized protein n=1 Tax=Meloidogyne enterolobii TaxID=390850 RepID=A0A6V7WS79_MELEN|nr:unnamed protein product [Meloidogyne enterolobii]
MAVGIHFWPILAFGVVGPCMTLAKMPDDANNHFWINFLFHLNFCVFN